MKIAVVLIFFSLFITYSGLSAQDNESRLVKPLFQSDEMLSLIVDADFKTIFDVTDDSTYFPATITFTDNDGIKRTIDIDIRTRGKTRRDNDICTFAPLRLRFPKKGTKNTPFEGQRAIKLVTHCSNPGFYEQNIIKEYLIYKAFNLLTDSSFKVRPAIVNYVYSDKKEDTIQKFAFFLEREKHLAERLQGIEIEGEKIHPNRMEPYHTCLLDMFQYMIGNTDYSIFELHNIIIISDSIREMPPVSVPYDFDWCGLVDANYAVPHPLINTEEVTERVYRGFRKDMQIVHHTIRVFNSKKEEIYHLFEDFELLNKKEKKEVTRYLDTFFWIINNENRVQDEFYDKARVVHN